MIRKSDIRWWVSEATKHPESAPQIIEALAGRLVELDAFNEHLREELIELRRRASKRTDSRQVARLQQQVQNLQQVLEHQSSSGALLVLIADDASAAAVPLPAAQEAATADQTLVDTLAWPGVCALALAWPGDQILLLTNQGRVLALPAADVEPLGAKGANMSLDAQGLRSRERISAALAVRVAPRMWTAVTRKGYAQRLVNAVLNRQLGTETDLVKSHTATIRR